VHYYEAKLIPSDVIQTFTMGGTAEYPGLKPRFIQELYRIAEKTKATFDYEFNAYLIGKLV